MATLEQILPRTLDNISSNPVIATSLNREADILPSIYKVLAEWKADLIKRISERRTPGAIIEEKEEVVDGKVQIVQYIPTHADAHAVLYLLCLPNEANERALIIHPEEYDHMRPKREHADEYLISNKYRHGIPFKLVSNKESHAFSILYKDEMSIKFEDGKKRKGALKEIALVGDYGEFRHEVFPLEWLNTQAVRRLVLGRDFKGSQDRTLQNIVFPCFVYPASIQALLKELNLETHALMQRIGDMWRNYRRIENIIFKRLAGEEYKEEDVEVKPRKKDLKGIDTALELPQYTGEYPLYGITGRTGKIPKTKRYEKPVEELNNGEMRNVARYIHEFISPLKTKWLPRLQSHKRAVDLAVWLNYFNEKGMEIALPLGNLKWERHYSDEGYLWNRLPLDNQVSLLYRIGKQ